MQITLENLDGLERKLTITVPVERIDSEVKKKLLEIAPKAKIAGFRPGKVPFEMVEQRYADSVRADIIEQLVRQTYAEALQEKKLNPAGMPKIEVTSAKPGEEFSYTAILEVYPKIDISDLSKIEIEKAASEVTEDDINDTLEKLRKDYVEWKAIEDSARKSQKGDQLMVDFVIKSVEGSDEEPKTEKNIKIVLGDGNMWDDFEKPLYDVAAGDEKSYSLKFPASHMDKALAGKKAEFEVTIHEVCEPVLPELDDKFAEKLQIKEGGFKELKAKVSENMKKGLEAALKDLFKKTISDKMLLSNPIEIPKALVENELTRLEQGWKQRFTQQQNPPKEIPEFPRKDFEKQAGRSVSLGLLLGTIVGDNKLEVAEKELRDKIRELAATYADADKVVDWYFQDESRLSEIRSLLLEEKAFDYLASQFKVIDKTMSYNDVIENTRK